MNSDFGYFHIPGDKNSPLSFQNLDIRHRQGGRMNGCWWLKNPQLELLKTIEFTDRTGTTWRVPAGFTFNGNSVPWCLWWLCPPEHSNALAASCVHDMLCVDRPCSSKTAARVYWEALRANRMYSWGAWRNWFAVRFFGPRFKPTGRV